MRVALGLFVVLALASVGQLVNIQVLRADEYADRGSRQRVRTVELAATRGRIYDRDGEVLATSVTAATVFADPRAFRPSETPDGLLRPAAGDAADVARRLAPIVGRDAAWIEDRLARDAHFVYLARQLDHAVGQQVLELGLPGIGVLAEPRRVYPAGGLAAQVVGFTGVDDDALAGIELHNDTVLRGRPGSVLVERAPGGIDIAPAPREVEPPQVGTDLVLTIDRGIQSAAERIAAQVVVDANARAASVVVLEVGTGEVLAMANVPTFDPNVRLEEDQDRWRNRALTDVFEPGSIQKALTVAAALEAGAIGREQRFDVADRLTIADKTFSDVSQHGIESWTAADVLARSSNVGTIRIAQALGAAPLHRALLDFGYGRPSGLGWPGEASGLLADPEDWWSTSLPTIAIGHGTAVTLMQIANAYATIANDGVQVQPRLVRGTVGSDGNLTPSAPPASHRVVSASTARDVRSMLEQAVIGSGATGALAAVPGHRVAGKTGTALKPIDGGTGYHEDRYVASFVGFAPVEAPRIVVAVMVDEPFPFYGGVVAAPVFSEVMHAALLARRVAPDAEGVDLATAIAAAEAARRRALDDAEALRLATEGLVTVG
jgi:cell division protein FtsI (penicillin-binding protein 3)